MLKPFLVGTCIILRSGNYVLMGKRKGSHGDGTWSFPGGHVDGTENPADSVLRELFEETGIDLKIPITPLGFCLTEFSPEKRYITLYFGAHVDSRLEAKLMEPNKCSEWGWFDEYNLPQPLFEAVENMLEQQRNVLPDLPAITYITKTIKPLEELTASDVPRGLSPDDVAKL